VSELSAKGERRPLSQSVASGASARNGSAAAPCVSASMIPASVSAISRSRVGASTSSVRARISRNGQQSSRLNQA